MVQFDGNNNMGWYDIDVDFLRVVDKPPPKEEPKPVRAQPRPGGREPRSRPSRRR